ncbi:UROD/MetE-like protein [Polychaeton citri CBS 116435]|uniref:UROD/MetE-like protein n=1 Tax=Polychaeton citri CBS 116435 TaxID=1314669 RepID=A0A9P4Q135_9PEZI|nr:UROD/MetE-like protein [Polychaeton citri CBS 116435]
MPVNKIQFHADHIGSLLRPQHVADAQDKANAGEISQQQLEEERKKAIACIVDKELQQNVRAITTGEFDRKFYFSGFFEKLRGFRAVDDVPWEITRQNAPPIKALQKSGQKYPMAVVCDGKIEYDKSPYLDTWKFLRSCVPKDKWSECKFTMPPAPYFHLRLAPGQCYNRDVYRTDGEFFADLAECYRQEFKTLYDEGLRNIQIDDPTLAYFCSDAMTEALREDGEDPHKMFDMYLKAHNDCLEGRPEGLHVGLHICRGNFSKSLHFSEGSYEAIAERFFKTLNYDTFYLEYDNPRSGGFEPLRYLPKHKNVVLGVITTKDPKLEDKHTILDRVRQAAQIIADGQGRTVQQAMQNIGISPQCGFASVAVGAEGMTEERMFKKLKLVREVAGELWPGEA